MQPETSLHGLFAEFEVAFGARMCAELTEPVSCKILGANLEDSCKFCDGKACADG